MKTMTGIMVATCVTFIATQAMGIEYKKNTIGGNSSVNSTFTSFSSSSSQNGSNITTVTSTDAMPAMNFQRFDWASAGFGNQTLDQRIRNAEQRLFKLYFTRDVCRTLEDEIRISFDKQDIRKVLSQVSEMIKTELPYELPEGTFIVEKSDVSGMPLDRFLSTIAQVCGLTLQYKRDKLVFVKRETRESPKRKTRPKK